MKSQPSVWVAITCAAWIAGSCCAGAAEERTVNLPIPPGREILGKLRQGHPRLLASAEEFGRLKERVKLIPQFQEWHGKLQARAQRILADPPSRYEIPDGLRLLSTSRRVLDRSYTLSLLFRLDSDQRYAERLLKELEAAAAFPDWNPRHFLDSAEMTHAFAIAYDWLFDSWTPEQRRVIRTAIVEKGLEPALGVYRKSKSGGGWPKSRHNWNQVCNGGIGIGALAIGDELPELAGEILQSGLESIQLAMAEFAPDGAWKEGPGYWNYATTYNVAFIAALESALGSDFGLSRFPGFSETGLFPIYLTGPLGRTFNYADGSDGAIRAAQMHWLARKFDRPAYARYQRTIASPAPLDLVWFDSVIASSSSRDLALDKYFRGVEVATFRSAWDDREAVFVALKAGDNKANHSNLDLGTFVLDALGTRWALDLGADNYNMPGYFGKQRWTYYRMRAEGHNTLVVAPSAEPDQDPAAAAKIVQFQSKPERAFAIADLTPGYAKHAKKVRRGVALLNRKHVLVQDEIETSSPQSVWWFMHTPASAELSEDKTAATLSQGNARLAARILSPPGATFGFVKAEPLPTSPQSSVQAKNETIRKLAVNLNASGITRLAVLLVPLREGDAVPSTLPSLTPLGEW
ncbi:MAG: heparinase II/III family protein [Verrucomicrobia bacterium]|nr:heparinase II/III family protein [Verrucomicrobiota bacterium]